MSDTREAEAQGRIAPYRLTGTYDGSERTFALFFGENFIGAADDNHIVIAERGVSRFHAVLSVESQQVRLFDRDSKNGCFRNGEPLRSGTISTGDELDFGPVRLRLVEAEDDSPIAFSFPRRRLGSAESGAAARRASPVARTTARVCMASAPACLQCRSDARTEA